MAYTNRYNKYSSRRRILADDDIEEMDVPEMDDTVETALLFEAEDVAELLREVTGKDVDMDADEGVVNFIIDDETFTITPPANTEVVESSTRHRRSRSIRANSARRGRSIRANSYRSSASRTTLGRSRGRRLR